MTFIFVIDPYKYRIKLIISRKIPEPFLFKIHLRTRKPSFSNQIS